ncbi:D-TA family PLP-dependent enzyme [Desertivirga brevis]|uniref:D-TA family PLP-dependent enzyme n=1 Tax=Desertivirga brevis TaxID=2810310 RepID=UPI001A966B2C|nr:D-TA family PLP-dependent enzyme [Pedobacter sp. SYSU D00873]
MWKITNADQFDTPYLAIDVEVVKKNILSLINMFGGTQRLRPHVKTHKSSAVVKLMLEAGISKFKCSTIAEAEMVAASGGGDILLAYPVHGVKIDRFLKLASTFQDTRFSCLTSDQDNITHLASAAAEARVTVNVLIDLNVGMNRTGIRPDARVEDLFVLCKSLGNIHIAGLHAYDGHLIDVDEDIRLSKARSGFETVEQLIKRLKLAGYDVETIVAGSTPTLNFYAGKPNVECSPGTFIYWDQHYQKQFPELPFKHAAVLVAKVIDQPAENISCIDLGYKSISSEDSPCECAVFPGFPELKVLGQSEEHMLVQTKEKQLALGQIIYALPFHIGRTCNLYSEHFVIQEDIIKDGWESIAAIRQITF